MTPIEKSNQKENVMSESITKIKKAPKKNW